MLAGVPALAVELDLVEGEAGTVFLASLVPRLLTAATLFVRLMVSLVGGAPPNKALQLPATRGARRKW